MKTTLLTTTIHVPELLTAYAQNARAHGHAGAPDQLDFVVVGDRKTPAAAADFCRRLADEHPFACTYLDIPAQQEYLSRFPRLWQHLRFDSIQRRNIGLLWAYEHGAEVAITIDDDNFALGGDFIGLHRQVGSFGPLPAFATSSGWFNVCGTLAADDGVAFYHRGYPWDLRWREAEEFQSESVSNRRIVVNAGLWLDDPDIDALARMARQPVVRGRKPGTPPSFCLEPGTWSPFNSQNTSLLRAVLPAYFLSPYNGRYDDIWASYIIARIAEHLGDVIAFGEPWVRQKRNPHDLWRDLDQERDGMILTPGFCHALRNIALRGASYHQCFGELADGLAAAWSESGRWTETQREWRQRLLEGMAIWHATFDSIAAAPLSGQVSAQTAGAC
ncbi:MAG TPA: hypothetical protein VN709_01410 [Terriglobales bacterium]|nr:hypothetical protein [Terriglobales bacterium]